MKIKKIIDLTQPLYHNCPGWPTYSLAEVTYEAVVGNDGFNAEVLKCNAHTGTHLDAPFHFFADGETIDQIPIENYIGDAILINLSGIQACHPIGAEDMKPYEDKIKEGSIVLLYTGWCKKRSFSKEYYRDWPYLSGEGAKWLLSKGIKGVGIDSMSMGGWYEGTGRPCHVTLLSQGIWLLEEMNFPDEILQYEKFQLTAVPLKLKGFGGSPTRAYATIYED